MKARFLIPFFVFVLLVVLFFVGLKLKPHDIPSPLIGKAAPNFRLPQLQDRNTMMDVAAMRGQVWLLNVWATWCVACREEHETLVELSRSHIVPIVGLSYKEVRGDSSIEWEKLGPGGELDLGRQRAQSWFLQHGNPYTTTLFDIDGRVGIDYGVYGVPETYLIDKQGIIRYKQIGPIAMDDWNKNILPKIRELMR